MPGLPQVDIAQPDQFEQYQRILSMLSRLGVGHILYAGNNSALSSPSNNTDDWGWEVCLWLNEGQQLREGEWVRTHTHGFAMGRGRVCTTSANYFLLVHGIRGMAHGIGQ